MTLSEGGRGQVAYRCLTLSVNFHILFIYNNNNISLLQTHGPYRPKKIVKVLEKCTKNLIGHSRLAFNNHESNIDC